MGTTLMMKHLSAMPLPKGWHSVLIAGAVVYLAHLLTKGLGKLDSTVNTLTEPAGQLWSDIDAKLGGWSPVEQTDLIIQPWYLDDQY